MTIVFPAIDLITAISKVSDNQMMVGKLSLKQSFQPAVMLHPFGKRVSDQADMIPFAEFNRLGEK